MKAKRARPSDELRVSAEEFDRIMGKALRVSPENPEKVTKRRQVRETKPARSQRDASPAEKDE
jgi:hypothetical protein